MSLRKCKVGVVGCGSISGAYLGAGKTFPVLDIVACADIVPDRAREMASEFGIPRACGVEELLADPEIEMVINLTIPRAHVPVGIATLQAGKCADRKSTR